MGHTYLYSGRNIHFVEEMAKKYVIHGGMIHKLIKEKKSHGISFSWLC